VSDAGAHAERVAAPTWFLPCLLAIVLAGGAVRAPLLGIASSSFRLTDAINLEESENLRISTGMLHKGSLNPHYFGYPSLFYYLSLGLERGLSVLGENRWSTFLVGSRAISLAFGLGTIMLCGLLALRLGGPAAGLLAASLVAFDATSIETSTLAKPNSAQVFFVVAGLTALTALAARARLKSALVAAACFALAASSKWLGALGLPALAFAGALSVPAGTGRGVRGILHRLGEAARRPVSPWVLLAPVLVFAAVFALSVPFSLLSPREFGVGFALVFLAQGAHQRALPFWISIDFLFKSLGPVGFALVAIGLAWALVRVARWDGSERANALLVLTGWVLGYGALVLFAFARLPSYIDLLVPVLAILAGCAWLGPDGLLRRRGFAPALVVLAVIAGLATHGLDGLEQARAMPYDSRVAAGAWLNKQAADGDVVVADQGAYVPDRIKNVHWNAWGGPDRMVYDETRTWGQDRAWPEWYGGHRQLVFRNAKWAAPESALVDLKPRWVITTSDWAKNRLTPPSANDWVSPRYDRALADGSAGYTERARISSTSGPLVLIYERAQAPR
jgi:4-amino-4-deoxy-L-arabinose transferase-like glycosyltransferase